MVTNLKHKEELTGARSAPVADWMQQDDEISLFDVWNVIVRHRIALLVVFLLVTSIGTVYALTKPEFYSYKTVIEVGMVGIQSSGSDYVDTPGNLLTRINEVYVPALEESSAGTDRPQPDITVSIPKKSNGMLMLESEGLRDDLEAIARQHDELIDKINAEQADFIATSRQKLEADKSLIESRLNEMDARIHVLRARPAMSDEIALLVTLGTGYQSELKAQLDGINAQLAAIRETRAVAGTHRSVEPLGPGRVTLITMTIVMGIILGIFVVFVIEFFRNAGTTPRPSLRSGRAD